MTLEVSLPSTSSEVVASHADRWRAGDTLARMWGMDPTVWADPGTPEIADRLGWLDAPKNSRSLIGTIEELHAQAVDEGVQDIVLCGMGGSSLAPEVFAATLPFASASPKLTVIDSTHPDAVTTVASSTDPATTWYVVASKSGGTIETMSLFKFFWQRASERLADPGSHFVAITDPGTSLEALAEERGFRDAITADPNVGGRYSALTAFGLVPAGLIGADLGRLLDGAQKAADLCGPSAPLDQNPGFALGVVLAEAARNGDDKAQFLSSDPVSTLGVWIEQLVAESTGKEGLGIVPIDGGQLLDERSDSTVVSIGSSVASGSGIELAVTDEYDVGGAMFILEFAVAVAGSVLGINPFDQPDVQLAKKLAAVAMERGPDTSGPRPPQVTDARWLTDLLAALDGTSASYVSIQAYIPQTAHNNATLTVLRTILTALSGAHVTVGYGPRFLHSTGQLHKGGPAGGVYLQIIDEPALSLPIPGADMTFNNLIAAQAAGDRAALIDRDRTVICVDLGTDVADGLATMLHRLQSEVPTHPTSTP